MKNIIACFVFFLCSYFIGSAQINIDSLKNVWSDISKHDTIRLVAMDQLIKKGYLNSQPDSAFYFSQLKYDLAKNKGLKKQMAVAKNMQGISLMYQGKYTLANKYYMSGLHLNEEIGDKKGIAYSLNYIGNNFKDQGDFANALENYNRSLIIREELKDEKGISASLNNIGVIYYKRGEYDVALSFYNRSLFIKQKIGDKKGIAYSYINMGINFFEQGNYVTAIDYYMRALSLVEEIGDNLAMSSTLNNIALIYSNQEDYDNALEYHNWSLNIKEEMGDKKGITASLNNIGAIYSELKNYKKAFEYLNRGLEINIEIGEKEGVATSLNNIGKVYFDRGNYEKAKDFYQRSLSQMQSIGEAGKITNILRNIGDNYYQLKDYSNAIKYCERALIQAQKINNIVEIKEAAYSLYTSYKATGKSLKALKMHELYLAKKDSIDSEQNQREVIRQEYKYSYDRKATADSVAFVKEQLIKDVKIEVSNVKLEKSKIQQIALYSCLTLLLAFLLYVYNRYRVAREQKLIIAQQNQEIITAMEQLKKSQSQYKALFNSLPDALLVFDDDETGLIHDCNDVAVELLGKKSKEELIGNSHFDISTKPIELEEEREEKDILADTSTFEFLINKTDGSKLPVLISKCSMEVEGRNQVFALIRDISDIKTYQEELEMSKSDLELTLSKLKETHVELRHSKDKLSEVNKWLEEKVKERTLALEKANKKLIGLNKAKSQFLNIISHEIRTPLNGIIGGLKLLKDVKLTEETQSYIEILDLSANRLEDFSKKALDISLINLYNRDVLELQEVKISDVIANVIAKIKLEKEDKDVHFKITHNTDIDTIIVDPKYLSISLFNIIHNSVKFSPNKSIVFIDVDSQGYNLVLTVRDEGVGFNNGFSISDDVAFNNENHVDDSPGLGLYLANQIIKAHDGYIENGNNGDKGAFIKIFIPINQR